MVSTSISIASVMRARTEACTFEIDLGVVVLKKSWVETMRRGREKIMLGIVISECWCGVGMGEATLVADVREAWIYIEP